MTLAHATTLTPLRGALRARRLSRAAIVPLTVAQYQQMIEQRIVPEDATTELLRGVVVWKDRGGPGEDPMAHSPLHRLAIIRLTRLAAKIDGDTRHVQVQLPVVCDAESAPEPDAAIIRGSPEEYLERLSGGADTTCVFEAAYTSLDEDREDKLPIYASAGIPQYVLVNLQNRTIEVYEDPDTIGETYRSHHTVALGGTVELRLPEGTFALPAADLLP